jgi:hypothetical protein
MIGYDVRFCNYCKHSIIDGQLWVREKIYDPRLTAQDTAYCHFHAEPFEGQQASCWETYLMQREMDRIAVTGGNASTLRAASLFA